MVQPEMATETVARLWIDQDLDPATREEAQGILDRAAQGDPAARAALDDMFGGRLAFGTAGLRGAVGPGPKRMNRVVVSQTSAGFAAYLHDRAARGVCASPPSVIIGFDGRSDSERFARDAAEVMAGAGVEVTLLPGPSPTPVTAFAVRHRNASAGVMITASHNPPGDNGYKVYLGDEDRGSQITAPVDSEIAARIVEAASSDPRDLPRSTEYERADGTVTEAYIAAVADAIEPEPVPRTISDGEPLRIVYTAMHGVGAEVTRAVFARIGLPEMIAVTEQNSPDGRFPTVEFPNPEEPGALDLAEQLAREHRAHLIVAHDPDADRLAIALPHPDEASGYRRLTGNQLGLLLGWRVAEREHRRALAADRAPSGALACTVVSSPALSAVARAYGLGYAETLSGFKWVSRVPGLLFGFEEALGYLTDPSIVRDKDGILAAADAVALVTELHRSGRTLWDMLDEAAERFGAFASTQITVRLDSPRAVEALAERIRQHPPRAFDGLDVHTFTDLLEPGRAEVPANVLRFDLEDGSRVMIRPSGTEPKLKLYIDTVSERGTAPERREAAERALTRVTAAAQSMLTRLSEGDA